MVVGATGGLLEGKRFDLAAAEMQRGPQAFAPLGLFFLFRRLRPVRPDQNLLLSKPASSKHSSSASSPEDTPRWHPACPQPTAWASLGVGGGGHARFAPLHLPKHLRPDPGDHGS